MTQEATGLAQMQRWMHQALITPGRADLHSPDDLIEQPDDGSAAERLAIYQRSYHERLLTCMREQFPALCFALGEDIFNDLTRDYLRAHPPQSYTLYDLGRRFPAYLESARPDRDAPDSEKETWIDFIIELTRFERLILVMFDAPGQEGKGFARADTPDDRLVLQPCFALFASAFPVAQFYHAVKAGTSPELPPAEANQYALVRKDFVTRTLSITRPQYCFLELLEEGQRVADALNQSGEEFSLDPHDAHRHWSKPKGLKDEWLELGFFVERTAD